MHSLSARKVLEKYAFFELTDQNCALRMGFICVPGTRILPNPLFLANGTEGVRVVYVWEGGVGVKIENKMIEIKIMKKF